MTTPGWYNDEQDPALARWHDGHAWTTGTLVIADWQGPDAPPPPDDAAPLVDPDPPIWADDATMAAAPGDEWGDEYLAVDPEWADDDWEDAPAPRHAATGGTVGSLPRWAAPVGVLAALLVAVLALNLVQGGGDGDDVDAEETAAVGDIDAAVADAREGLPFQASVSDSDLKALIRGLCDVAEGGSTAPVASDAALAVDTADQLAPVLAAAARGAATYCPDATGAGGAVDEVAAAASLQLGVDPADPGAVDPAAAGVDGADGAADSGAAGSSSSPRSTTQPTTRASTSGGVTRTETRSNSSTNPNIPGSNSETTSGDETNIGNQATNNQTTRTTIRTTTTSSTVPAETTTTVAPAPPTSPDL